MIIDCKKKFLQHWILIVFFFNAMASVACAQSDTAATQLSQLLQGFRTYQAYFNQTTYDHHNKILQQATGRIWIQRPGGFRWETEAPTQQVVMTDGRTLWIYDVDLAQATQQSLNQQTN